MMKQTKPMVIGLLDKKLPNAGTGGQPKKMVDMDEDYFDHYVQADYKALYFMSQAVARQMMEQGCEKGTHPYRIINLSSAAGIKSPIGDTVYGSLKAAVTHHSRPPSLEIFSMRSIFSTVPVTEPMVCGMEMDAV